MSCVDMFLMTEKANRIFDSGVGGITVLKDAIR